MWWIDSGGSGHPCLRVGMIRKPKDTSCTLCPVPLVPLARPRRPGGDGRKVLAGAVSQTTGNRVKGPVHL